MWCCMLFVCVDNVCGDECYLCVWIMYVVIGVTCVCVWIMYVMMSVICVCG